MIEPSDYTEFSFPAEGVWIYAPANLVITISPAVLFAPAMATQDDIQVLRFIGNLKFMDPDDPSKTHFDFSEPVRFQVRFTGRDEDRAKQRGKAPDDLAFAWWDGSGWQKLDTSNTPVNPGLRASSGGFKFFQTSSIDDPAIIWGT